MEERERGFTLIELLVTVSILLVLMLAGGVWLGSMHPGALRGAVDSYDSAIAAARAIASGSGNGATIAFLPRTDPHGNALTGYTLVIYNGRPTAPGSVTPSNVMRTNSDATVSEKTLGSPPFAIFLSSAGSSTGESAYPQIDRSGDVAFAVIAQQPVCPAGGLVLTFTGPQGATATRALGCNVALAGSALPNPSPTPNVPILTPAQLIFYWPSAAEQEVVATEWGYTHWFASTTGFTCGKNVAAYPSAPQPYQSPPSAAEAETAPAPPIDAAFSYPSSAQSMNDAPAPFPIQPQRAGSCTLSIEDAFAQTATSTVNVMGELAASPTSTAWSTSTDHSEHDIELSKTFDDEALRPSIIANTCAGIAQTRWVSQSAPSSWSDTASVELGIEPVVSANGSNVGGGCTLEIASQYPSEPPVSITVNVALPVTLIDTWPEEVELGIDGNAVSYAPRASAGARLAMLLNGIFAGSVARAATTSGCRAYALTSGGSIDAAPSQATALGIYTDANGCFTNSGGTPLTEGAVVAWEPGGTSATYSLPNTTCIGLANPSAWDPASASGVQVALPLTGGSTAGTCAIGLSNGGSATPTIDHGLADVNVVAAMCTSGSTLPLGDSCTFDGSTPGSCDFAGGGGGVDGGPAVEIEATGPETSSGSPFGAFTVTRTGAGTITVTEQGIEYRAVLVDPTTGTYACDLEDTSSSTVITLN